MRLWLCTMEHFDITVVNSNPLPQAAYVLPAFRLSLALAIFALLQLILYSHDPYSCQQSSAQNGCRRSGSG